MLVMGKAKIQPWIWLIKQTILPLAREAETESSCPLVLLSARNEEGTWQPRANKTAHPWAGCQPSVHSTAISKTGSPKVKECHVVLNWKLVLKSKSWITTTLTLSRSNATYPQSMEWETGSQPSSYPGTQADAKCVFEENTGLQSVG